MSVKIRLARIGKKNAPAYKIVVANTRDKRNGKALDVVGHYNPSHNPQLLEIDKKKYEDWIKKGAQVTDAVKGLVDGTYQFEAYTRQNEEKKEKAAETPPAEDGGKTDGGEEATTEAEETKEEEPAKEEVSENE
jgi:small subunit ribosomal protein S16